MNGLLKNDNHSEMSYEQKELLLQEFLTHGLENFETGSSLVAKYLSMEEGETRRFVLFGTETIVFPSLDGGPEQSTVAVRLASSEDGGRTSEMYISANKMLVGTLAPYLDAMGGSPFPIELAYHGLVKAKNSPKTFASYSVYPLRRPAGGRRNVSVPKSNDK